MKKISILFLALALVSFSYQEEAAAETKQDTPASTPEATEPKVDEDGVVILDDSNITQYLADNKYVFVEFYARKFRN